MLTITRPGIRAPELQTRPSATSSTPWLLSQTSSVFDAQIAVLDLFLLRCLPLFASLTTQRTLMMTDQSIYVPCRPTTASTTLAATCDVSSE